MRIDVTPSGQPSLGLNSASTNRTVAADGLTADSAAASQAPGGRFQPSSNFQPLIDNLARIPLIRQEVVGEVAKLLSGGVLDTPRARQQTVESILGTAPGHD